MVAVSGSASRSSSAEGSASQDGRLRIGGLAAADLVREHGSPIYAFDAGVLQTRLAAVRAALGERVQVLFALKANANAAVAAVLRRGGAGCEVASAGEILIARRAGFAGSSIQFAGPGKHDADLDMSMFSPPAPATPEGEI